jgi:predicted GNAT superfamily acetyltransferase
LIRRNAYLYLIRLGAQPIEYLQNFYGVMSGAINGDAETDRMLVNWDLRPDAGQLSTAHPAPASPAPTSMQAELARGGTVALGIGAGGWPSAGTFSTRENEILLVAVPEDIEGMRRTDPARAGAWRLALRDVLAPLMAAGGRVTGFDRDGWYVLSTAQPAD